MKIKVDLSTEANAKEDEWVLFKTKADYDDKYGHPAHHANEPLRYPCLAKVAYQFPFPSSFADVLTFIYDFEIEE